MNILVLCTGNSARSILAEYTLNHLGRGRVMAYSAGSKPTGMPNPFALAQLRASGIDPTGARSKSWDEFALPSSPPLDMVVTVCGNAAGETCPIWHARPGQTPVRTHWGVDDPAAVEGPDEAKRDAFRVAHGILTRRIEAFFALDWGDPKRPLQGHLDKIGDIP
jgi:arsenate reductase (thioredoxin)